MFKKLRAFFGSLNSKFSKFPKAVDTDIYTLALCCIVKDENEYLEEWISYHLKAGVEHFYIYDNGSGIPVGQTLNTLGLLKYTTVTSMPGKARQVKAYNHCLKKFGSTSRWIGFIDVDEFIVAKTTNGNLVNFLTDYESYGGLGINWLVFGSGGHIQRTNRPQLESFVLRSAEDFSVNKHIKNIVQPKCVSSALGAHSFAYKEGKFAVNEDFMPIEGSFSEVSVNKIRLNHYYCRSKEEYEAKIKRGYGDTSKKREIEEFYYHDQDANKVKDTTILELFRGDHSTT